MSEAKQEIILPTKASKPEAINARSMVIYGLAKSGKTTAISQLPNCLIIDTENGTDFLECTKLKLPDNLGPVAKRNWLKEVAAKIKEEGKPYDYVAIDTFSELDILAEWWGTFDYMNSVQGRSFNRVKDEAGKPIKNGPFLKFSDPDYESVLTLGEGYGYRYTRAAILEMFDILKDLGKVCTIFVSHVADKMVSKKGGAEIMTKDLALVGKTRDIIPRIADAIGHVWNEDGKFMISFKGGEDKVGGIRAPHLRGFEGELKWNSIFI